MSSADSGPALKLSYFKVRGRAELTRLVFAAGCIPYDDERVSREEQKRRKDAGELPFGQFPTLTVNGQVLAQSYSVAKYAGKLAGLLPTDPLVALQIESIVDATDDIRTKFVPIRYKPVSAESKLEAYADFFKSVLPPLLDNFEKILANAGGPYFVGSELSLADLAIFNMCDYLTSPSCEVQAGSPEHAALGPKCLSAYPLLTAHKQMVADVSAIAAWLDKRPKTPHDNVLTLADSDYS